jgi:hypothetical protein
MSGRKNGGSSTVRPWRGREYAAIPGPGGCIRTDDDGTPASASVTGATARPFGPARRSPSYPLRAPANGKLVRGCLDSQVLTRFVWTADTFPMGVSEELRALGEVVDRLAARFPAMSREQIEEVVQQEHSMLDAGRVRAFIPVLVEHAARDRLSR